MYSLIIFFLFFAGYEFKQKQTCNGGSISLKHLIFDNLQQATSKCNERDDCGCIQYDARNRRFTLNYRNERMTYDSPNYDALVKIKLNPPFTYMWIVIIIFVWVCFLIITFYLSGESLMEIFFTKRAPLMQCHQCKHSIILHL